jgi:hypothetical protein
MPEGALYLSGALTAFHLYMQLYQFRDQPVVIDDVDALFKDRAAVNLLKCLCNTDAQREVFWGKRTKQLDDDDIPRRFTTSSRVCILANELRHIDANLGAVLDRAFVLRFEPSAEEVHRETGTWFKDREVHEFFGNHLRLIPSPSMRMYLHAAELKRLGTDWRGWLLRQWTHDDPKLALVAEVLMDPTLKTTEQRVERFRHLGGGSRATYMRSQARWRTLRGDSQNSETLRPADNRPRSDRGTTEGEAV